MAKQPERVSVVTAAELLGVTPRAVRYAITRGVMSAEMIGSVYAIPMTEVKRYGSGRNQPQPDRPGRASSRTGSCRAVSQGRPARNARRSPR